MCEPQNANTLKECVTTFILQNVHLFFSMVEKTRGAIYHMLFVLLLRLKAEIDVA